MRLGCNEADDGVNGGGLEEGGRIESTLNERENCGVWAWAARAHSPDRSRDL